MLIKAAFAELYAIELAVPRSYSPDFQHLLASSAAEFKWPH